MEIISDILAFLPFEWTQYQFMRYAALAIILITPLLSMLGTMAVSNSMAFFSDALGHSALTGVGIGVVLGMSNQLPAMIAFGIAWAVLLIYVKLRGERDGQGNVKSDTIISVFSSTTIALGLIILSRGGSFARYSELLVGDVLGVTADELYILLGMLILIALLWGVMYNRLLLTSVNSAWAASRGVNVKLYQYAFAAVLALVVMICIQWVGVLLINSLLILPCAAARNLARSSRSYTWTAVLFAEVSGVAGLVLSFYLNTSAGAAIVLVAAVIYFATLFFRSSAQ